MDFTLGPDREAIAELAAGLLSGERDTASVWARLAEARILDLLVPEAKGGVGLGFIEMTLVLVEQGRALAPAPLWRHALAAHALEGKLALGAGDSLATLALDHGLAATAEGNGWSISGNLFAVPNMATAKWLLVPAAASDGEALFLLPADATGIARVDGVLTDGESASDLSIHAVRATRLPQDGEWLRERAALCLAALQVGVADGAIRRTAEYVSTREQFGRAIGSFQAVAQRAADAFTDVEVARTLMFELAWRLDAGEDARTAADIATYWANHCGHRVAHAAMHLHGGIGADTSYPIHRVLLWSRALEIALGGRARQLARIGERLAT